MITINIKNVIEQRHYIVNYEVLNGEGVAIRDPVYTCIAADLSDCEKKFKAYIEENTLFKNIPNSNSLVNIK
jgi:hypothetical protein